jgi:hypothetical protein
VVGISTVADREKAAKVAAMDLEGGDEGKAQAETAAAGCTRCGIRARAAAPPTPERQAS